MAIQQFTKDKGLLPVLIFIFVYVVGALARAYTVLHAPDTSWFYSDAGEYYKIGAEFASNTRQDEFDAIWPPGTSGLVAILMSLGASVAGVKTFWLLLSILTPLLIAGSAYIYRGPWAGCFAGVLASLHPQFIYYTKFFLSETPAIFFVSAALFLTLWISSHRNEAQAKLGSFVCIVGWMLCGLFRGPFQFITFCLALVWILRERTKVVRSSAILAGVIFFTVCTAFLSHRCTGLNGGFFCMYNLPPVFNTTIGFSKTALGAKFEGVAPGYTQVWVPPSRIFEGHEEIVDVGLKINDVKGQYRLLHEQFLREPVWMVERALKNIKNLFWMPVWPWAASEEEKLSLEYISKAYAVLFIIPGLLCVFWILLSKAWLHSVRFEEMVPAIVITCCIAMHALSLGDMRYRLVLDPLCIAALAIFIVHNEKGVRRLTLSQPRLLAVLSCQALLFGLITYMSCKGILATF